MKLIIAGSRTITDIKLIDSMVSSSMNLWGTTISQIQEVVCGGASGVDRLGEIWANRNKILVKFFYAEWTKYGKSAGPKRNEQMAKYGTHLIVIWDGISKGTKNMINNALKQGLPIEVCINRPNSNDSYYHIKPKDIVA